MNSRSLIQILNLLLILCLILGSLTTSVAQRRWCKKNKRKKSKTEQLIDSSSFSFNYGILLGSSLEMQGIPEDSINMENLVAGFQAALKKKISKKQIEAAQVTFMTKMNAMQEQLQAQKLAKEKLWFSQNAKNNTKIRVLESGIQYEVLKDSDGAKPSASSKVTTHYHGTLIDGTVFDSSIERAEPATFAVLGVIKGWQEILQLMPVGSKWKVYIPSTLAYGEKAVGNIPPNSILIFEIELLEIVKE